MQPEAIWLILAVDEVDEVLSDVVRKFCENGFALVFCEGTHCKVEVTWSEPQREAKVTACNEFEL